MAPIGTVRGRDGIAYSYANVYIYITTIRYTGWLVPLFEYTFMASTPATRAWRSKRDSNFLQMVCS